VLHHRQKDNLLKKYRKKYHFNIYSLLEKFEIDFWLLSVISEGSIIRAYMKDINYIESDVISSSRHDNFIIEIGQGEQDNGKIFRSHI